MQRKWPEPRLGPAWQWSGRAFDPHCGQMAIERGGDLVHRRVKVVGIGPAPEEEGRMDQREEFRGLTHEFMEGRLSRRSFLRATTLIGFSGAADAFLAACSAPPPA